MNPDVRGVLTYGQDANGPVPVPQSKAWNVTNPTCEDIDYSLLKPNPLSLPQHNPPSLGKPSLTLFLNYSFPDSTGPVLHTVMNGQVYRVNDTAYPTLYAVQEDATWVPPASEQRNLMIIPDKFRKKIVQIVLQSLSDPGAHPFHLHGHGFQVVASGVGQFDETAQAYVNSIDLRGVIIRDTVIVPKNGWVALRLVFPVMSRYTTHMLVYSRQSDRRQPGRLGFALSYW